MSDGPKAVFLSYASQDAVAARRIADALRAAGIEVWFDQSELRGGDAWDAKIRRQIKECALFVPIISANTQARAEGYFRLEWKLAVDRSHLMADDAPFLFPIAVGDVSDATARVPDKFREVQWTRLRLDETPTELAARVTRLLAGEAPAASEPRAEGLASRRSAHRARRPAWLRYAWATVGLILALVYGLRPIWQPNRGAASTVPPAAAAPVSEARQLADRAQSILAQGSLTRAQLDAAEELCDRALKLDDTDPLVWAMAAKADLLLIYPYGYDTTDQRRRRAEDRAARATSLGPDLFDVRVIQAEVFAHAVGTPALLAEAEKTFRELIASHPGDKELVVQLAEVLREGKRFDEAAKLFERVGEFEVAGWSYLMGGELRRALAAVDRSPRSVTGLQLKAILQVDADEDLDAAQATIDQLQPSELLAQMPAAIAIQIAFFRRDPARMLELAHGVSDDYLDSNAFHGPRGYFLGLADSLAGRAVQAQADWRAALAVVQARLQTAPDDRPLLLWSAWLHAALGDAAEAERVFARSQALAGIRGDTMHDQDNLSVLLRLRRTDALLAGAAAILKARLPRWEAFHADMRFSPEWDFLRGDPRFEKLLRDNLPPGARPLAGPAAAPGAAQTLPTPAAAAALGEKSVAVLAFENLSDDKENEYFSDGISEELLNTLAKVPGLKVTARTSSFYFKGRQVPVADIARQLGVAYLVEGSVRKQGERVRIAAQLVKASDGFEVWSDQFDRDLKDVFAVQDEIAGLIAKNLQITMGVAPPPAPIDPAVHNLVLQARFFAQQETTEGRRRAVTLYQQAVAAQPDYARAWAELGRVYAMLGRFYGGMPTDEAMTDARAAARRALALNPDEPSGLNALGWVQRLADWNWLGARKSFVRAAELAPGDSTLLADAAVLLCNIGQVDEAVAAARRAVERDPLSARAYFSLGEILSIAGRDEESEQALARGLDLSPESEVYYAVQAWTLSRLHRYPEAEASVEKEPNPAYRLMAQAIVAHDLGHEAESAKARDDLIALSGANMAGWIGIIYAHQGHFDEAFTWLERAARQHDRMIPWMKNQVLLGGLRRDPRWPVFLHEISLADDQLK